MQHPLNFIISIHTLEAEHLSLIGTAPLPQLLFAYAYPFYAHIKHI